MKSAERPPIPSWPKFVLGLLALSVLYALVKIIFFSVPKFSTVDDISQYATEVATYSKRRRCASPGCREM
jgi:hypothetical protein